MSAIQDLSINHLHGTNGVTEKIKRAMYDAAKQFVYIGFLLWEVQEYKYYEEAGFANVYEYAEFELGFKRSSTKNFIAIARVFGTQEYTYGGKLHSSQTMNLQPKYEKFNYSQLVELLAMSERQRDQAKPDMTIKQLRQLKKKDETVYCTINEDTGKTERIVQHHPAPEATGQTSGQAPKTEESSKMHDASWWVPEEYDRSKKLVKRSDDIYKPWDIGYYNGSEQTWHDQHGNEIQVTEWMDLPGNNSGQTSGQKVETKSAPVNNIWKQLHPSVIKEIVKAAGLHWNPKTCYNINVEKHIG